jgi:hypothetical protein
MGEGGKGPLSPFPRPPEANRADRTAVRPVFIHHPGEVNAWGL